MMKHFLKLAWNRKRTNILILLEILVSFIVLFAVILQLVHLFGMYRQPLGYTYHNVWNLNLKLSAGKKVSRGEMHNQFRQIALTLRNIEGIEAVAALNYTLYQNSHVTTTFDSGNRQIESELNMASDGLSEVLDLDIAQGRWFRAGDAAGSETPIVVTRKFYDKYLAPDDPLGKVIPTEETERNLRVVGVLSEFRIRGELSKTGPMYIERLDDRDSSRHVPGNLLLKVREGVAPDFEHRILETLKGVSRDFSFKLTPLSEMRAGVLRSMLTPIFVVALVGVFLTLMVGLGLVGILWQNVTRRRKEIGLRRAVGGSARRIYLQILGEVSVLALFGILAGGIVVVQLPLFDIFSFTDVPDFVVSMILAGGVIILLAGVCALYPAWLATRIQPSEALHYE